MTLASVVSGVWEEALRASPDPWETDVFGPRRTYRERLDRPRFNMYGQLIPRIVAVRRHINLLGKPRRPPRLPA